VVCGRKISLFFENFVFGAANLSSTWEDCSSNARSIHNNVAEEVKLGFLIFFYSKCAGGVAGRHGPSVWKVVALDMEFLLSPKMWGKVRVSFRNSN
jgi:hypothetical protein